jgi:aspartate/methionine/tyrosine aminotransferase
MELLERAAELEDVGKRVVHLEVGEPDFATAPNIVAAGVKALTNGQTKYTQALGLPALRETIARYYAGFGVSVDPNRVVVTSGASGGLTLLAALLLNPGDELLITDPGYPCNEVFAHLVGAIPRPIAVAANQHFQPNAGDVDAHWGEQTRGILLASPANPTGTMLRGCDIRAIAQTAASHDGFFILDEIYQGITGVDCEYPTGLSLCDDLYILNSFSKFFGMTGWRLGWMVVPEAAVPGLTKLAQNLVISPSTVAQYAALHAFDSQAMALHTERARTYLERASIMAQGLRELGFVIPVFPDGAFYLYVDVSHTGMNSHEFCWRLLEEFQVAATPGEDFGQNMPERFVRFAYTTDEESIRIGLERIGQALGVWGATASA